MKLIIFTAPSGAGKTTIVHRLLDGRQDEMVHRRWGGLFVGGESGTEAQPHVYLGSYVEYVERTGHEAPGVHA